MALPIPSQDSSSKSSANSKFGSSTIFKKLDLGINHGNDLVNGFIVVGIVGVMLYYFTGKRTGKKFVPINKRKSKGK